MCFFLIYKNQNHIDAALSFIAVYNLGIFMLSDKAKNVLYKKKARSNANIASIYFPVEESHQRSLCKGFPIVLFSCHKFCV